jgi:hypothetical protein
MPRGIPFPGPHGSGEGVAAGCLCTLCRIAAQYLADHADDVLILCPWCGDWEEVEEIPGQLATGRFWGCAMCVSWRYPDRWPCDARPV